jgi:hypothetical protein
VVGVGVGVGEMLIVADPVDPWKVTLMDAVPGEKPAKKSIKVRPLLKTRFSVVIGCP